MAEYLTLQLNNTTSEFIPVSFNQIYQLPLLDNPNDYDISVIRFKIPNFVTPFFTIANNHYSMNMVYNGSTVTRFLTIVQRTPDATNKVYDYQQMAQMLNSTIASLISDLSGIVTLPSTEAPYFTYSETTKLFSFVANKNYYMSNLSTPIIISLNLPLFLWIAGIPCINNTVGNEYTLLCFDEKNNVSGNYVTMTQQTNTLDLISDFSGIVFTSSFPTKNEYIGGNVRLPILQDFIPNDLSIETFYNSIVYNAITPYRQCRMISNAPIHNAQIDCYIVNNNGQLTPALLPPGQSSNIKLMFTKHERNHYA